MDKTEQKHLLLKSKKGFTLVELTIVLAVTMIVITMACGFILTYRQQTGGINKSGNTVSDITTLKRAVNAWLSEYESGGVTVNSGKLKASNNDTLEFSAAGKKLVWKTTAGNNEYAFMEIVSCTFEKKPGIDNVIYCTVNNGKDDTVVVFDIFNSSASRERYFSN